MSMITPPVRTPPQQGPEIDLPAQAAEELSAAQSIIRADKSAAAGGLLHAAVLLDAAFGLHLSASQVAILGTIISAGISYFLSARINARKP